MQVSIKFCGGCNPNIDRVAVAEKVKKQLENSGIAVNYNNLNADFVLYINGCKAACVSRQVAENQECAIIAGSNLNNWDVSESDLSQLAVEKVQDCMKKWKDGYRGRTCNG
jgi:hypothetical protein